jgi:hypothetical protein
MMTMIKAKKECIDKAQSPPPKKTVSCVVMIMKETRAAHFACRSGALSFVVEPKQLDDDDYDDDDVLFLTSSPSQRQKRQLRRCSPLDRPDGIVVLLASVLHHQLCDFILY